MQKANHKRIDVPPLLRAIPQPPKHLFHRGQNLNQLLQRPRVAIVGSRRMSPYGRGVTEQLATQLAGQGIAIVSGLAYGVDACAHEAALTAGGQCIAVLGNGIDRIYPAGNYQLAQHLLKTGAIISEYPPGESPRKHYFLERNRLVAGLADAVIITEAAERSGTLNTAAHALDQGKPVFAVPGNITSPLSAGTNNVLKSGGIPLTSVEDVLQALNLPVAQDTAPLAANQEEATILKLLQTGITDGAQLLAQSKLAITTFNQTLTMLEITAKIKPLGANQWRLA